MIAEPVWPGPMTVDAPSLPTITVPNVSARDLFGGCGQGQCP
jgi:hypothetical protein